MKRILIICPLERDRHELAHLQDRYEIIFYSIDFALCTDVQAVLASIDVCIAEYPIDGVMSTTDDLGALLAAIVAQRHGLPGPDPQMVALQQHKYYARETHQKCIPESTPFYSLFNEDLVARLPLFIKPVRGNFSRGSCAVYTTEQLQAAYQDAIQIQACLLWRELAQPYLPHMQDEVVIAEGLCSGLQCTVEGYVYNKKMSIIGIVDSIMFPGTISFKRFDYPSSLPRSIQARIAELVRTLIAGIGFDNGCFNIECIYNSDLDTIHVIEMNPRLASQFADLYEKVDGFNSYALLCAIATGQEPQVVRRAGSFSVASSCVLRTFVDKRIAAMPTQRMIENIYAEYSELRLYLFGQVGQKLSELLQDGKSFRYGLVHIGGSDLGEIESKLSDIEHMLAIELVDL